MAKIEALLKLEVKDKNGEVISSVEKPCKSFTLQLLAIMRAQMFPSTGLTIKDVDGTSNTVIEHSVNLDIEGIAGDATKGILLGTGTTPVTLADFVMETLIAHGVGATQLSYGGQTYTEVGIVSTNVDLVLTRAFTNSSGGTINVTEVGIYMIGNTSPATPDDYLVLHEIVSVTPVTNGQTVTATITFRTAL